MQLMYQRIAASNKKLICIVVLILAQSIQSTTAGTLPLVTGEWPPFTSKDLKGQGFYTQFISEVIKEMGMQPEIIFVPWSRATLMLASGEVFGAFPYAITEEREEKFYFSNVINYTTTVFFYNKKYLKHDVFFKSLNDLKPYRIAVARGHKSASDLAKFNLIIDEVNSNKQSIILLNIGRAHLSPINELVGWHTIKQILPEEVGNFGTLTKPLHTAKTALMISKEYKNSEKLRMLFNQALIRVNQKDTYKKILINFGFTNNI
ncbi:substrate-binding periplasmic protein [Spartinivicinus poritis]|uniref:Transporter substrate-binding domain-containing protein n=1 Tax=Spartinivicinus poritis TaxID=2994640 RepID=A0ABT5UEV2_9GAMM|nr:transporter substrate-binding domain-containing protein [Spartinivicinus sp. A2-2]MDE1464037.1 transporter substrate-binding domain-containing protein [Spartinivicinus sp. A2-2]